VALDKPTADEFLALWNELPVATRRSIGSPTPEEVGDLVAQWDLLPTMMKKLLVVLVKAHLATILTPGRSSYQ
jgi:hypothetical protein